MENNVQENNSVNITNNEEKKPEKKGLPILIIPTILVLIICIVGGIFLSKMDFNSNSETSTPNDDKITENKPNEENNIVTPSDEIEDVIISTNSDDIISTPSN